MKTSNVLASLFFGSLAAAMPLDKRAYATTTEVVTETVVIYTTVWDGTAPHAAAATTAPGLFYEHPSKPSSSEAEATSSSSAAYTPPAAPVSEVHTPEHSAYTPPAAAEPTSVYTPPAAPSSAPAPSHEQQQPKPSAPATNQNNASPSGETYSGDITIYDNTGAAGACGKPITDGDMVVALAKPTWGESTYDVMTGESTNPWCGQKITIEYEGNQIDATIMDMCPECAAGDIDLSLSAWKALTGLDEKTRKQATWWKSS